MNMYDFGIEEEIYAVKMLLNILTSNYTLLSK